MPELKLRTVTRTQGNNQALKDRTVKPRTCEFEFVEVDPLIDAFRRMVRGLEFDVSEMAMTTYITARAHGKRLTGLPIFLVRAFHHGAIVYNTKSGIKSPKDLEGRRVGVNRGYTVTTGLWARGVLQHAASPQARGHGVAAVDADVPALQILGAFDAGPRVVHDRAVMERAYQEDRQAHETLPMSAR